MCIGGEGWYVAVLVTESVIRDDPTEPASVWLDHVLVRATNHEEAYRSAMQMGEECRRTFENEDGEVVEVRFAGLSDLTQLFDELEHGAELFSYLVSEPASKHVRPRDSLFTFFLKANEDRPIRDILDG